MVIVAAGTRNERGIHAVVSSCPAVTNRLKIDVLKPVASARLVLHPQQDEYFMNFLDKPGMAIGLNVQPASQTSEGVADAGTVGHHPGRKQGQSQGPGSARDYLELHGVLKYVQSMLTALIQAKPKDPYDFMLHQLSSSTSCASARQPDTGPEDQALRADACPEAVPVSPPKHGAELLIAVSIPMQTGTVKSYNPHKGDLAAAGWGFVECNGQDSFLHNKELKGQCPSAGDQVAFKVEPSEKGTVATEVTVQVSSEEAFYAGEIKRFNPVKGYGFISCEAFPEQDVFVLKSELPQGFGPEGGRCKFKVAKEEKGPAAKQVQLLGAAEQMRSWMGWGKGWGKGSCNRESLRPQDDLPVSPQPPPAERSEGLADSLVKFVGPDAAPGTQADTHSTQREALAEDTTALTEHSEEEASRIRLQTVLLKAGKNGVLEEILQNLFRSPACSCELSSQQHGQPGDGHKIGPTPLVMGEQTESGLGEGDASQLRAHVRDRLTNAWTTGELKEAVQEALEHNGPKIAEATAEQSIQFLQDEIKIMAEESKVLHEQVDRLSSEMQRLLLTNQQLLNQIQNGESAGKL
ncbi:cspA [Symbiodinium sp. CCMP2456]|nr:cspA [Symbiodinium sp. CCMP2456]